ncbi:MAG: S8 family serine peptidase, partial [Actinomycetota bacterium]|nr:S8 family serine peptidase [Actinomycetota bacterium]
SIDGSSSRGEWDRPETWPDIAAPGTEIISTCRTTLPVCAMLGSPVDDNYYSMTGTSMAAPSVAGIVAQVLQADPSLTPPEVENLLEDTAHKFSFGSEYGLFVDETNPDNSSSFEKGHGLVDALAAVRVARRLDPPPGASSFPAPPKLPVSEQEGFIFGALTFIGISATEQEFARTCLYEPPTQALDGFVFEIPERLRGKELFARVGGVDPIGFHVLQLSFYNASCKVLVSHGPTSAAVPTAARYAVVTAPFAFETTVVLELYDKAPSLTPTTIALTETSATYAQTTDQAVFSASLVDDSGAGLAGETVTFTLSGGDRNRSITATTDDRGIATTTVAFDEAAGSYDRIAVAYAGSDTHLSSSTGGPFELRKDDAHLVVTSEGSGSKKRAVARLTDSDSGAGIADRLVRFFADGSLIGEATTDSQGMASVPVPPAYRGTKSTFSGCFSGDDWYLGTGAC